MPTESEDNPGKRAAIFGAILLTSAGLCGASYKIFPDDYVSYLGLASLFGMIVGLTGLAVSIIQILIKTFASKDF